MLNEYYDKGTTVSPYITYYEKYYYYIIYRIVSDRLFVLRFIVHSPFLCVCVCVCVCVSF